MTVRAAALTVALWAAATPAHAQTVTSEAAATAGVSSDDAAAMGAQVRAFGEVPLGIRYYVEGAWAWSGSDSDAFGAAYPYRGRLQPIEVYGEWLTGSRMIAGARAGRFRTPFGISGASDHAYTGFLRSPLIRYDGYFAISNSFLEHGVEVFAGVPSFTVQASIGRPADVGEAVRRPGRDVTIRTQSAFAGAVVGVSYLRTKPYQSPRYAFGDTTFAGVDVRWMMSGVQIRGEWLGGRPFDGVSTTGWYADAILHRPDMGRLTLVGRLERLDYETVPAHALHARRQTAGARLRLGDDVSVQVNVLHQTGLREQRRVAVDVGVIYSVRR